MPSAQIASSRSDGRAPERESRCDRISAPNDDAAKSAEAFHGLAMKRDAANSPVPAEGWLEFRFAPSDYASCSGSTVCMLDERRIRHFSWSFIRSVFPN